MKGQALLISYTLTVLLSVIFILFSSLIFSSFYSNFLKNQVKNDLESVSLKLYSLIITAYEFANNSKFIPKNNSCIILEEIELYLPSKISSKTYEILVQNSEENLKIEARAEDSESFKVELPKVYVNFQGKIKSERKTRMYYYRCNLDNEVSDKIVFQEIEGF
ncbi:MAG: hypothetical protein QW609_01465 [Candidatus Aenigmatarchaeota archaeon]